jgi:hypothetical protein
VLQYQEVDFCVAGYLVAKENRMRKMPLGLRPDAPISPSGLAVLQKLESYKLTAVEGRLVETCTLSAAKVPSAMLEFKRLFALIALMSPPLAIPNGDVDEVWHQCILFTREYERFCRETVGRFVHHLPNTEEAPVPYSAVERSIRGYEDFFGPVPAQWLEASSGEQGDRVLRWSGWVG